MSEQTRKPNKNLNTLRYGTALLSAVFFLVWLAIVMLQNL